LDKEGWTALHLSCNKSREIFHHLAEQLGADLSTKNPRGISLMHKAAFDDNTYILTYLRDKAGHGFSELDNHGNTPLHFACDNKKEFSAMWLMGFGADVNVRNENQDTPLHLLLKNGHRLERSKLVRELIFKGSDKNARNVDGLTALEVLQEEDIDQDSMILPHLKKEIEQVLGEQPLYCPCFQFKQPLMKLERSKCTMIFYVLVISGTFILLHLFVFPFINKKAFCYPLQIMFILQFIVYFITATKDPGFVHKSNKISFLKLNQYFHPMYICPTCEILRPKESRHCYICNKCIDRHDHHC